MNYWLNAAALRDLHAAYAIAYLHTPDRAYFFARNAAHFARLN